MSIVSWSRVVEQCPACGKDVVATMYAEVGSGYPEPAGGGGTKVTFGGTLTGQRVSHDCVPKVTR